VSDDLATATCAGKTFEHHERTEFTASDIYQMGDWRCPECGATGNLREFFERLLGLLPTLDALQRQCLNLGAVILVPADATPGHLGECFG
jgi:hypothetical protein